MCWGCNPLCGGCRPPRQKSVLCPQCGHFNVFDVQAKGEPHFVGCEKCGLDLTQETIPIVRYCLRFDTICANPCGLHSKIEEGRDLGICNNRIEPDQWHIYEPNSDQAVEKASA